MNYYYSLYFYGIIISTLFWPTIIKYISKWNSLLLGLTILSLSTIALNYVNTLLPVYILWLI